MSSKCPATVLLLIYSSLSSHSVSTWVIVGVGGRERQPWKDKSKRRSFLIWLFAFLLLLFNCWIESLVLINSSQTVLSPKSDEKEKVVLNGIRSAHWEEKKNSCHFQEQKMDKVEVQLSVIF